MVMTPVNPRIPGLIAKTSASTLIDWSFCFRPPMTTEVGVFMKGHPLSLQPVSTIKGVRILIRPSTMWRAFFCAVGIVLIIMGIECLLIDSAVLVAGVIDDPAQQSMQQSGGIFSSPAQSGVERVFRPSEWFPWSLLASGSIVLLYSISLKRPA